MKKCSKCNIDKPIDNFGKAKAYKDGFYCWCKECTAAYHREKKKNIIPVAKVSYQECKICKIVKSADLFTLSKSTKTGIESRCKQCYRDVTRERRGGLNPKTVERHALAKEDKFRCGLCNKIQELKEKVKDGCCYQCNRRKARINSKKYYNTEKRREQSKKYAHRERTDRHKRRARLRDAIGNFTKEQLKARFEYHGDRCIYCKSTNRVTVEHMIPLCRGGTNWASNIAPSCYHCNTSKGKRTHKEFLDYQNSIK